MKKLVSVLMLMCAVAMVSLAQITTNMTFKQVNTGGYWTLALTIEDSGTVYNSNAFSLGDYDGESFATYPLAVQRTLSSVSNVSYVNILIQASMTGGSSDTWTTVDTVAIQDSVETTTYSTHDLNSKKYPYYRFRFVGTENGATTNHDDATFTLYAYAYRRDPR